MDGAPQQAHVDLELRDYLGVLRRRWKLVSLVTVLVTAGVLAFSLLQTPVYEARAAVLLDSGFSQTILFADSTVVPDIDEQVTIETDLMRSGPVERAITEKLGFEPDVRIVAREAISETTPTRVIEVIATSTSKSRAANEATGFAESYVEVRKALISEDLRATILTSENSLNGLDDQAADARVEIGELNQQIPTLTGRDQVRAEARRDRLAESISTGTIAQRQAAIDDRLNLLREALVNNEGRGIFKLNEAQTPKAPISPTPKRDGAIALLCGLGLGIAAAFLRDYYDDAVRTKEDLDVLTQGVPVLGIIPAVKTWRDKKDALLESITHPNSAVSESYRGLRTSLEFARLSREIGIVHVTSSTSGEGKSTTAANLAVSLARAGNHVVLVDCDLRRPRAHEFFGLQNDEGFTTVLLGTSSIDQALQRVPEVPGLFLLASGPQPPNPSELLDSDITRSRLQLLARSADFVIVDSPPLLPVSDSVILSAYADATLVVVRARSAKRRGVKRSLELLTQVDAKIGGLVLNGVGHEATYGYGYGYGYINDDPRFNEKLRTRKREAASGPGPVAGPENWTPSFGNGTATAAPPSEPTEAVEPTEPPPVVDEPVTPLQPTTVDPRGDR